METLLSPKYVFFTLFGGALGWLVGEFKPAFPLIIVAVIMMLYDAWTAYKLDRRAHHYYPDKTKRHEAKFTSFAFSKVIKKTIPNRLWLIFLAYLVEHWVFIHVTIHLSYIVTGAICLEQGLSILENESSCRPDNDGKIFRFLRRILVDKTSRHFDDDFHEFTENDENDSKRNTK